VPKSEQWDRLTRSQVLTERGYPEQIVSPNGSTPAAERVCAVCEGSIPADRPSNSNTCSTESRDEWRLRQRRRNHHEGREPPTDVMELLTRSRAELLSVELTLGGQRWLLTRQD
jgi:hypothetical protein